MFRQSDGLFPTRCVPTGKTDLTCGDRMLICLQSSVPLELAIRSELKKGGVDEEIKGNHVR
jgi:hypothetical protein